MIRDWGLGIGDLGSIRHEAWSSPIPNPDPIPKIPLQKITHKIGFGMRGVVVKYNVERGFGFIRPLENEREKHPKDFFVHISGVENQKPLIVGQNVTFEVIQTPKGPQAVKVRVGFKASSPTAVAMTVAIVIGAPLMALAAIILGASWQWSFLIAVNLTTLALYAYDKTAATRGVMRMPENVLHGLHLLGGSPLALIGQLILRHKTRKQPFQTIFWGIVAVQIVATALYLWLR